MIKKILTFSIVSIVLLSLGDIAAFAYQIDPTHQPGNTGFSLTEVIKAGGATGATIVVLQIIAGALLYFAVPIAVILILMAAFNMVLGGADSEKLEQAKKHLTWAIIGLLCIVLSYSIVKIIISLVVDIGSATADVAPAATPAGGSPSPPPPPAPAGGSTAGTVGGPGTGIVESPTL